MKLSTLQAVVAQDEEQVTVPLYGKNGETLKAADGSDLTITVVGSESKRYRAARDAQTRRMLRQQRKLEPGDLRTNRIDLAAAAVVAWHGLEDDSDAPVVCTPENVKMLLGVSESMLEQVEEAISRHASAFLERSPTS